MPKKQKSGAGTRKFGRMSKSPAHIRYNAEKRWEKNKARRIAKQRKFEEKKKIVIEKKHKGQKVFVDGKPVEFTRCFTGDKEIFSFYLDEELPPEFRVGLIDK